MGWKNFLKPDKTKIWITIIILFIGLSIGFIASKFVMFGCYSWSCQDINYKVFSIISGIFQWPILILDSIFSNLELNFFIRVIYSYLLACIITTLTFRIRKE
jgi:hypothetical protein